MAIGTLASHAQFVIAFLFWMAANCCKDTELQSIILASPVSLE
uniref:Uncharacterized protein n=1 Tax=Setaria viridis TaxID=4556 RepID=A0A4U6TVK0_SETVI|nr:hypothetical protein SEVIR_7G267166v2 [Setaria viridis]